MHERNGEAESVHASFKAKLLDDEEAGVTVVCEDGGCLSVWPCLSPDYGSGSHARCRADTAVVRTVFTQTIYRYCRGSLLPQLVCGE